MLKVNANQINAMILADRSRLRADILDHLIEFRPLIVAMIPADSLARLIDAGIEIGLAHGIDDVQMLRVFVRLRWDIAPGFYKQPAISAVLKDKELSAQTKFDHLISDEFEDAWEDAEKYSDPQEWSISLQDSPHD